MKHILLGVGIIGVAVIAGVVFFGGSTDQSVPNEQTVQIINDPLDAASSLVSGWIALQGQTTPGIAAYLSQTTVPQAEQARLVAASAANERDVLHCQQVVPNRIGAKIVGQTDTVAEVMVLPRGGDAAFQTIVQVELKGNEWQVVSVVCAGAERPIETGEFAFEQSGHLLRESLPSPYDNSLWHLVFAQDGVEGNVVPLMFDEQSVCKASAETVLCDVAELSEALPVSVGADMTESGAIVRELSW